MPPVLHLKRSQKHRQLSPFASTTTIQLLLYIRLLLLQPLQLLRLKEATPGTPADPIPEGFKPPDGAATSALQTWTNMDTGETWTANTGGWTAPNANWTTNPDKWTEDKAKTDMEAKQSLFGTMMTNSSKYIDELKKGFTGAVTMGERDGPSLGGAQFTNEFRDYAKSMGYEIDRGLSPMDGPSFLVRPEGWTPDAFNAHIKTQEETAATPLTNGCRRRCSRSGTSGQD
jgi:hypothetical protein